MSNSGYRGKFCWSLLIASPEARIDSNFYNASLREAIEIISLPNNRQFVLFVDNCSSHFVHDEVETPLAIIKTNFRMLPANAANFVQPDDSFIIQNIRDAWRERWDKYMYDCINTGSRQGGEDCQGSGILVNPGKKFFFNLVAYAVLRCQIFGQSAPQWYIICS